MTKAFGLLAIFLAALAAPAISASEHYDNAIARFSGGIGVQPVLINATTLMATADVVRGVSPGLLPWTISGLKAEVGADGEIDVRGRGLVLAGGPPIGTRGDLTSVRVLLFCGPATNTAPFVSPVGALDLDGNFTIEGPLTPPVGPDCPTPTLLIVVGAGTTAAPFRWVAAGIVDHRDDD
jgi:hypothetical protein